MRLLLLLVLAGCTVNQSRHYVDSAPLEAAQAPEVPGRVIAGFDQPESVEDWTRYVVKGSVNDPEAAWSDGALRVTSDRSAGLFWHQVVFDADREPLLRWRWRVSDTWDTATPLSQEFDNFPARLLVGFDAGWDGAGPAALTWRRQVEDYTGHTPPSRAICYTFGGRLPASEAVDAAFGEGRIVVINLRRSDAPRNEWQWQVRDLASDYRAIFGAAPPPVMALAVGSDSHRVDRLVHAEFDDITVYPAAARAQFARAMAALPERTLAPLTQCLLGLSLLVAAGAGWWLWRRR